LLNDLWKYSGTNWTWVSGSNSAGQVGTYGTRGTPAQSNVPGARELAVSWLDSTGSLWLFGGYGYDSAGYNGSLNDLWKYDPITLEWAWVSGSSANGQVGTYGTQGTAAASNIPGARFEAVSWLDSSGKLWLFGGWSYAPAGNGGGLNDLWKYDPATLEWTWVSGSNIADQAGTYGLKGTANSSNIPGARGGAVSWLDSTGKLWLFGGYGYDSAGLLGYLNDLWMYDGTTWTWISGSRSANQLGTYGTQGIPGPTNVPGVRELAVSWLDSQGKLLLFGGFGFDLVGNDASLNDLWKYDPATLEWTWVSGSSSARQLGIYGTKGAAAPSNVPGARYSPVSWLDSGGKLWLFGGRGYDSTGNNACLNDLWRFTR
jgi:N-acetylneuraminic acid mutarotase